MGVLLQLVCLLAVFVRCQTESYPDVLREAMVPVYNQTLCKESYASSKEKLNVTGKMLCAGYSQGGIGPCPGDSGGPLVALSKKNNEQYYLIGIVSFGNVCARKGFPGVYTRVTQYEEWINETISGFPDGATCGRRQTGVHSLVIGGCPAKEHAWPWMVAIFEEGELVCGASLIDPLWVITAAHCVKTDNVSIFEFGMGTSNLTEMTTRQTASKVYVHPKWNKTTLQNDIALFKLSEPVELTKDILATVCLPTEDMDNQFGVGHNATVTGWGETWESPSRTSRTSPTCPTSPTSPTNPTNPTNPTSRLRRQDKIIIICLAVISGILLTIVITGLVWYLRCERKGPGLLDTQRSSPSYMTSYNMSEVFPTTDDTEEIIDRVGSRKC